MKVPKFSLTSSQLIALSRAARTRGSADVDGDELAPALRDYSELLALEEPLAALEAKQRDVSRHQATQR